MPPLAPPSTGQLVRVRERVWAVEDVRPSSQPADPLGSGGALTGPQHLVRLQSVEDDGAGEVLDAIWELEPGAEVYEQGTLPDHSRPFDRPEYLQAFLDAVRWGAIASADVQHLNAPFRAGIRIEDYQLEPVARALKMPRVNLLIADDVGLGKTIEAGLVLQEMLLRHRARTVLVLCPAGLQAQWRDEMRDKFGLDFRIVNAESISALRRERGPRVNPWRHYPRLIASIDFIKQDRILRGFRDAVSGKRGAAWQRPFDLLILDEAHNVAPSGRGKYAKESQRTTAIREIAGQFEHRLFLTATPHNGYQESFAALLELLDDQRFKRVGEPDRRQVEQAVIRRLKRELPPDDLGRPRFPQRVLKEVEVKWTKDEREAHRALKRYTDALAKSAGEGSLGAFAAKFLSSLLKKRLFSCPAAFASTLEQHLTTLGKGTDRDLHRLRQDAADLENEYDDDEEWEDDSAATVGSASRGLASLTGDQKADVELLREWAEKARDRSDSKCKALMTWLEEHLIVDGEWTDERVIIFTEYRATQSWLHERLNTLLPKGDAHRGDRIAHIYGGMKLDEREQVKARFLAPPDRHPVRILVATDAASEGIDLQKHCSKLFHYEIPWNPNRLEQRNGRVDRHGQKQTEVHIHHFVSAGWSDRVDRKDHESKSLDDDLDLLYRVARKVDQIREDLGSAGQVLSTKVEEAMLGKTIDLDRLEDERAEAARRATRFERDLRETVKRLRADLDESRDALHLSPANLRRVVETGLELSGHDPLAEKKIGEVEAFEVPPLKNAWLPAIRGLRDPLDVDGKEPLRPVVFEGDSPAVRAIEQDVVRLHLGSRLVQMCLELLRAEIWAPEAERKLSRTAAVVLPSSDLDHPALIGLARVVLLGTHGERLHEELIAAGGTLESGRFRRLNVGETDKRLSQVTASDFRPPYEATQEALRAQWPTHADSLQTALEARGKDRAESLAKRLDERRDDELKRMRTVLETLREEITKELQAQPPQDYLYWTDDEKEQLKRDREYIERRRDRIESEMQDEERRIHARYEDPQPRLFPVAVLWLVPDRLNER